MYAQIKPKRTALQVELAVRHPRSPELLYWHFKLILACLTQVVDFNIHVTESGEEYNETIEVDTQKQTEVFKVPAHPGVDRSDVMHDFKQVIISLTTLLDVTCCVRLHSLLHVVACGLEPCCTKFETGETFSGALACAAENHK